MFTFNVIILDEVFAFGYHLILIFANENINACLLVLIEFLTDKCYFLGCGSLRNKVKTYNFEWAASFAGFQILLGTLLLFFQLLISISQVADDSIFGYKLLSVLIVEFDHRVQISFLEVLLVDFQMIFGVGAQVDCFIMWNKARVSKINFKLKKQTELYRSFLWLQ